MLFCSPVSDRRLDRRDAENPHTDPCTNRCRRSDAGCSAPGLPIKNNFTAHDLSLVTQQRRQDAAPNRTKRG